LWAIIRIMLPSEVVDPHEKLEKRLSMTVRLLRVDGSNPLLARAGGRSRGGATIHRAWTAILALPMLTGMQTGKNE
jgi:hypothetical protein